MKKRSGLYPGLAVDGSGRNVVCGPGGVPGWRAADNYGVGPITAAAL